MNVEIQKESTEFTTRIKDHGLARLHNYSENKIIRFPTVITDNEDNIRLGRLMMIVLESSGEIIEIENKYLILKFNQDIAKILPRMAGQWIMQLIKRPNTTDVIPKEKEKYTITLLFNKVIYFNLFPISVNNDEVLFMCSTICNY